MRDGTGSVACSVVPGVMGVTSPYFCLKWGLSRQKGRECGHTVSKSQLWILQSSRAGTMCSSGTNGGTRRIDTSR